MRLLWLLVALVLANDPENAQQSRSSMHGFSWGLFSPKNGTFTTQHCEVHHCDLRQPRRPNLQPRPGHLQRMGEQFSSIPPIAEVDADDLKPAQFYENYVAKGEPVLVRGAARGWPAYRKWGNATYLRENCKLEDGSDWQADVEVHKNVVQNLSLIHI